MEIGWNFNFGKMSGSPNRLKIFGYLVLAAFGVLLMSQRTADEPAAAETEPKPNPDAETETETTATEATPPFAGKIVAVRIVTDDLTDGTRLRELRQLLTAADEQGAEAIVFEINTRGGYKADLAGLLLADLPQIKTPIHSLAKPSALGMGALLALSSNTVYVTPTSVIGGAIPFEPVEDPNMADVKEMESILLAQARTAAKIRGQREDLVNAFVKLDFELRLQPKEGNKKKVIVDDDEILTLTAEEALEEFEDGPLLAKGTAETIEDVIEAEGLTGEVFETTPNSWTRDSERETIGDVFVAEERPEPAETPFGKLPEQHFGGKILVIKVGLEDLMSEARFEFMKRVLDKARAEKPNALIFDMHTPGGYAWHTTDLMMGELMRLPFPTYTYVNTKAKSAGAMIAIATDHIYMAPVSTIGAALVVSSTGQEIAESMAKKIQADIESTVKNVAAAKGRDEDVCLAFVTDRTEVVRDGVVLCKVGEVLDLNAVEATKDWDGDGKPLLAKGMADSIEDLIAKEGLEGEVLEVRASPLEKFAQWTQIWAAVLILFGLAGAYLEANSPGFGIPGIVSLVSFSLYFLGNYVAGNLAGWETVVVFVIGVILLLLEIFVFSGTLLFGLLGGILMIGSLVFAMVSKYDFGELIRGAANSDMSGGQAFGEVFRFPMLSVALAILMTVIAILLMMRFLPNLKPVRWLILETEVPTGPSVGGAVGSAAAENERPGSALLGKTGTAETDLRPSGLAKIDDEVLDAITESEFIKRGAAIKVKAIQGTEIVVTKA